MHEVLLRLLDCNAIEDRLAIYERHSGEAKELCAELLKAKDKDKELAIKDRDIALKEAAMWKSLYESIKQKPHGAGWYFCKIFTIGIASCR